MSDIKCDIIKDLLPLYADDMCSEATKKAVNEHIVICKSCRDSLEKMRACPVLPTVESDTVREVKKVSASISRKKKKAVIKGVAVTLAIVLVVFWFAAKAVLLNNAKLDSMYEIYKPKVTEITADGANISKKAEKVKAGDITFIPGDGYSLEESKNGTAVSYKLKKSETDMIVVSKVEKGESFDEGMKNEFGLLVKMTQKGLGYNGITPKYVPGKDTELIEYLLTAAPCEANAFSPMKKYLKCYAFYQAACYALPIADSYYTVNFDEFHGYGIKAGMCSFNIINTKTDDEYLIAFRGSFTDGDVENILSTISFK